MNITYWIALYVNDNVTYFDSFGVEHISKESKKIHGKRKYNNKIFIEYKHTIRQCADTFVLDLLILCLKDKSLFDYSDLFSSNDYENNNKTVLKYFQ